MNLTERIKEARRQQIINGYRNAPFILIELNGNETKDRAKAIGNSLGLSVVAVIAQTPFKG